MRAARCEVYGPPTAIVVRDVAAPVAGPGEVLVGIEAASVNYPDVLLAADQYQVSLPTPFTVGSEFAGRVLAVGDRVTGLQPGDAVLGTAFGGAFAEQIAVPASALTPIPEGLDMVHAAAFNVTYRTAYHALRTIGEMAEGDWVVVLGAAGGVGTACVDVAARLGAKVISVASSRARAERGRALGACATIGYDEDDLKARIKEITAGGAQVVIDPVGGPYAEQALRAIAWGGRFVTLGFAQGEIPRIPLNLVLLKGAVIKGFEIRTLAQHRPDAIPTATAELRRLVAKGMKPDVSEVFSLSEVPIALSRMATRQATGKIVIDTTR
ncbi:MAG: NADPH:quinone oxidoreductase family protein [Gordonia sp. (in: high G+C Gram-positive bacteria)]